MSFRHYQKIFPELELYGDDPAQRDAFRRARAHVRSFRKLLLLLLGVPMLMGCLLGVVSRALLEPLGIAGVAPQIHSIAGITIVMIGIEFWIMRPLRRFLRRDLNERDVPVCMACGYPLFGIESLRCPECGTNFHPTSRDQR